MCRLSHLDRWTALLMTLLWASLYLPHLRTSPGWYGDETALLQIGTNLAHGHAQLGARWHTFLHTNYPYQPAFAGVVGIAARFFGDDIIGARLVAAGMGLATALSLLILGRPTLGRTGALFAALLFLTQSQAVLHFRMALPHGAMALGFTVALLFLLRPPGCRNDLLAGVGLAVAMAAHPFAIHGVIAASAARIRHPRSIPILVAPPALVFAISFGLLSLRFGRWAQDDLFWTATYQATQAGHGDVFRNLRQFWGQDGFHAGAILALLVCLKRAWPVVPFVAVPGILLSARNPDLVHFYYRALPLVPLICVAYAKTATSAVLLLRRVVPRRLGGYLWAMPFALVALQLLTIASDAVSGTLRTRCEPYTTQSIADVEGAARFINASDRPDAMVLCNGNIGWLLRLRSASYLDAVTWRGEATFMFERGVPRERFVFDPSPSNARFAVWGDIDAVHTITLPGVAAVRAETSRWPVVWWSPTYEVRENPGWGRERDGARIP